MTATAETRRARRITPDRLLLLLLVFVVLRDLKWPLFRRAVVRNQWRSLTPALGHPVPGLR